MTEGPLAPASGLLACPVCAGPLTVAGRSASCPAGHTFDVARQGYLNLLNAPPPAHADTTAMVAARDRVLASGLYDPVTAQVARRLAGVRVLAEVGAGTAHHLAAVVDATPGARGVALDVSVPAARRAARAHPRVASVVADAWGTLPLRSRRLGGLVSIFAPRSMPEFARVLGDGGLLVVVTPTPDHLAALRDRHRLLDIEPGKDERLLRSASGWFEPVGTTTVAYHVDAPAPVVRDVIAMGPNAFHGVPDDIGDAVVDVAVTVRWFRRSGTSFPQPGS